MGVVFKCHDNVLDRLVALKQLNADLDEDPHLRKRFIQEARAAARLNHRNIITIYALHEADTGSAMVMELLEGVDLTTLLKGSEGLPLEVKLNIMAQVCDGLDYAHKRGVIHRDIKPANLHVSPEGLVKILDFGIARVAASRMTSSGGLIGTPDYMSPEQAAAGEIDARSDLFAVGAVLYELLAGSKPFKADSITALLMKIVHEPHVPLRERAHLLPAGASELVERLLAKDPNARPSSAREVHDALLAISTEHPVLSSSTVAILATAVAESVSAPGPPAPAVSRAAAAVPTAPVKDDSSSKLASLAIERGRALRESGDLAGAMRVFRSVLELAPGNVEALSELEALEHAIAKMSGSGPREAAGSASRQAAAVQSAVGSRAPRTVPTKNTPTPVRVERGATLAFPFRGPHWEIVGAAIVAVVLLGSAAVYLGFSTHRAADKGSASTTPAAPRQASDPPASTSSKVESPPPVPPPPAVSTTPAVSTPPVSKPTVSMPPESTRAPAPVAAPVAAPPVRSVAPPANEVAVRTTPSRSSAADNDARPRETTRAEPTSAAPVSATSAAPSPPPVSPSVVAPRPSPVASASASALVVHHLHARSLRRGFARGSCDGNLQLLPDGLHFKTTSSADGRMDDKKITFKDIEDFEVDGGRIRIETDEQAWEFTAPADILDLIQQHIRANRKVEK
jgi:serine/threonine-protein kinase